MRISSTIKERLQQNADRLNEIQAQESTLTPVERIMVEYLEQEAETFNEMLLMLEQNRWRRIFTWKNWGFALTLLALSTYVVLVFQMFKGLDLSRVQQWEFVVTALPFWLMMAVIPMGAFLIFINRKRQDH